MFLTNGLHVEEPVERVGLDPLHHAGEEIVPFALVFDERILLTVAAQADPVTQVVHCKQVIFPVVVDHLEHEGLFQETHQLGAEFLLLVPIGFPNLGLQVFEERIASDLAKGFPGVLLALSDVEVELALHHLGEPLHVPLFRILFRWAVDGERRFHQAPHHVVDIFREVLASEDSATMLVDNLALLVHHVVVFEQLFADLEVVSFDLLLRVGDGAGDHAVFDRHAFFHAQLEHELRYTLRRNRSSSSDR